MSAGSGAPGFQVSAFHFGWPLAWSSSNLSQKRSARAATNFVRSASMKLAVIRSGLLSELRNAAMTVRFPEPPNPTGERVKPPKPLPVKSVTSAELLATTKSCLSVSRFSSARGLVNQPQ